MPPVCCVYHANIVHSAAKSMGEQECSFRLDNGWLLAKGVGFRQAGSDRVLNGMCQQSKGTIPARQLRCLLLLALGGADGGPNGGVIAILSHLIKDKIRWDKKRQIAMLPPCLATVTAGRWYIWWPAGGHRWEADRVLGGTKTNGVRSPEGAKS